MEALGLLLVIGLLFVVLVAPIWALVAALGQRARLSALEDEVRALRARLAELAARPDGDGPVVLGDAAGPILTEADLAPPEEEPTEEPVEAPEPEPAPSPLPPAPTEPPAPPPAVVAPVPSGPPPPLPAVGTPPPPLPVPPHTPLPAAPAAPRPAPPHTPLPVAPAAPVASPLGPIAAWFAGAGLFARVGAVVLLVGVVLLLGAAADAGLLSVAARLWIVAGAAGVVFALGWRWRDRRRAYALVLQGLAFGAWYVTVYAALRLYGLLAPPVALALLALLGAALAALATRQRSEALALLGVLGGYLAPVLAVGPGGAAAGSPAPLLGYLALLGALVLALGARANWWALPALGFVSTVLVGAVWGARSYRPADFWVVEGFLVLLFLMYALLPLWRPRPERHAPPALEALALAAPVAFLAFQGALLSEGFGGDARLAMAVSALGVAALYALLARTRAEGRARHAAIALGAFTLAVPLALGARLTAAVYALQGAALAVYAGRARSLGWGAAGVLVQMLAALVVLGGPGEGALARALEAALLSAGALTSAWALRTLSRGLARALAVWGLVAWLVGGTAALGLAVPGRAFEGVALVFVALSAFPLVALGRRLGLSPLRVAALLPVPLAFVLALARADRPPFGDLAGLGFAAALVAQVALLEWRAVRFPGPLRLPYHGLVVWLVALLAAWGLATALPGDFAPIAWGAAPLLVFWLAALAAPRLPWAARDPGGFARVVLRPLLGFVAAWFVLASFRPAPPPAWPALNTLDLTLLAALASWLVLPGGPLRTWLLRGGALLLVAGATLRGAALALGLPWDDDALLASGTVQTALTLALALYGVLAVWWAARTASRALWSFGAAVLGAVTLKLFVVDLAGTAAVARVVSFLGVGGLLLVLGYLAPVPPRAERAAPEEEEVTPEPTRPGEVGEAN